MKNIFINIKKGFTLIELLVVIAIISLVSVVTLTIMGTGKIENNLKIAQREITAIIKLTQSYALQGKAVSNGYTPCGFGFVFSDQNHYKIFYIKSETGMTCEEKNNSATYRQYIDESNSPTLEEGKLKNNIILKSDMNLADTEIYFTIPHANIYGSSGGTFGGTTIKLSNLDESKTKTVTISSKGAITED
jgi:prepilin-type N-terminal cleavage/methylation domain-containing protein